MTKRSSTISSAFIIASVLLAVSLQPLLSYAEELQDNSSRISAYHLKDKFYKSLEQGGLIEAQNILNEALEMNPNDASAIDLLGNLYFSEDKVELALKTYNRAIAIAPQYAHTYFDRGSLYLNLEDYDKALKDLRKAVELDPEYADFRMALGAALLTLDKLDRAEKHLIKAVKLDPKLSTARFYLGMTYLRLRKDNLASQQFGWILENDPNGFEAQQIKQFLQP